MLDHFQMFARYNRWANVRLFDAASKLSDKDYRKDCQAFFGSMHGTLNHLLVGDEVWMGRFEGIAPVTQTLDDILHDDFAWLRTARQAMDERIVAYVDGLDEERLTAEFTYQPITLPDPVCERFAKILAHFFNHQTHHRGQAHAILTRLAGTAPALDLIFFLRETEHTELA